MSDPRYAKLAKLLIEYSCELKAGENILMDLVDTPDAMAVELIRAARARGATPIVETRHSRVLREVQMGTDERHARLVRDLELGRIRKMSCVDSTSAFRVITMTTDNNYTCSLTWQTTLNQEIDVVQQNTPGISEEVFPPLEPFVTYLAPDGV